MNLKPPLYWRRRAQILVYNLQQTDPSCRIRVSRVGDCFRVQRGDERITIASIGRGPERMGQDTLDECTGILEGHGFRVGRIGRGGNVLYGSRGRYT